MLILTTPCSFTELNVLSDGSNTHRSWPLQGAGPESDKQQDDPSLLAAAGVLS